MKINLTLDRTIKVGDLLTTFTVVISLFALLSTITKDRESRELESADRVRVAAANAIAKLDRWQALEISLYQELQPIFVEMSEILRERYDVIFVRDQFWKKVNIERTRVAQKVSEEQLGTAYAELLSHFPAARDRFLSVNAQLAELEVKVSESFLSESEQRILMLRDSQKTYTTATLGNGLRDIAAFHVGELNKRYESITRPTRDYLFEVINKPDADIVRVSRKAS